MEQLSAQRRSFFEFVRIHGAERRFIARPTEVEALRKAVFDMGLPSFEAECLLLGGAEAFGVALESRVDRVIEVLARASTDRKGRVDRDAFGRLARYARALSNDALDGPEAEAKVKAVLTRLKIAPRGRGPFKSARWFRRAGRAAGNAGGRVA